jgi:hypothetical protein
VAPDNVFVVVLDMGDPRARQVFEKIQAIGKFPAGTLTDGRGDRPLKVISLAYRSNRSLLPPDHRAALDRALPTDIRIALLSEGHTIAFVYPAEMGFDGPTARIIREKDLS